MKGLFIKMLVKKKAKIFYGWWIVLAVFVALFFNYGLRYSFGIFIKPLVKEFSWSRGQTSTILSLHMCMYAFSGFIWGWLSDHKLGAKIIISLGCTITGLSIVFMFFCNSFWYAILFFSILSGIGAGAIYVPGVSAVGKVFELNKGFALGIVSAAVGLSYIWSPFINIQITRHGWRSAYFIFGLLMAIIGTSLSMWLIRIPGTEYSLKKSKKKKAFDGRPLTQLSRYLSVIGNITSVTKGNKLPIWLLNLMYVFALLSFYIVNTHLVPYLIDNGFSTAKASTFLAFIGILSVGGRIGFGILSDEIGRAAIFYTSFLLQGFGVLSFMFIKDSNIFLIIGIVSLGIGYGGWVPQFPAAIDDIYGAKDIGTLLGLNAFCGTFFGASLGPWFGGYLFDISGTYFLTFIVSAIASFFALAFSIFLFETIKL